MDALTQSALETLVGCTEAQLAALRRLAFKFEVQQMMLSGGRSAWLNETLGEMEAAIAAVNQADASFRHALREGALALGASPESTLRELAAEAPEPWGYIFEQGRDDLVAAVAEVGRLCADNRKLLARGFLATGAALSLLGVDVPTAYDASGSPQTAQGSVNLLNARA
ncbi:MAG TPA: flagellar export chaperone FlgN [Acidimicrobiales bacterium]